MKFIDDDDDDDERSLNSFLRRRMIGGGDPFYPNIWVKLTALERNRRFSINFARSASAVA